MKNVRIAYTVSLVEVPREVDNLVKKLEDKCRSFTKLIDVTSFSDDPKSSLECIRAMLAKIRDMETILFDCENLGKGLLEIEEKLTTAQSDTQSEENLFTQTDLEIVENVD